MVSVHSVQAPLCPPLSLAELQASRFAVLLDSLDPPPGHSRDYAPVLDLGFNPMSLIFLVHSLVLMGHVQTP